MLGLWVGKLKRHHWANRGNLIMDYLLENSIELILHFLSMLIM